MCNCGKKRSNYTSQTNTLNSNQNQRVNQPVAQQPVSQQPAQSTAQSQTVMFKYTGNTALTVVGSVTRKNYRFNFPGDIQHVLDRDASGFLMIPVLKKI